MSGSARYSPIQMIVVSAYPLACASATELYDVARSHQLTRSLALASVEEEEITAETTAALDRARASLARGEGIPHEEILREFGLNQ